MPALLERWPSGRRRSPAKGVWVLKPIEGSNPSLSASSNKIDVGLLISFVITLCAPVAQLDRVPGYEPGGRTFESCRAHHISKKR